MKQFYSSFCLLSLLSVGGQLQAQVNGTAIFDNTYVHEIRLTFEQPSYLDSLDIYSQNDLTSQSNTYLMATVSIDGTVLDSIGARYKGFSSNFQTITRKRPFKLDFAEFVTGRRYDGLKKLNLNNGYGDPSFTRDALAMKLMRDFGVASARTSFANLYINDTLMGLYVVVEQIDNKFVDNWFTDNNGQRFKCKANTDMEYYGDSLLYAYEFEQQNGDVSADWVHFDDFLYTFNFPNGVFEDSLAQYLNIPSFVKSMAVDYAINQSDGYGQSGNNFYLYRNPTDDRYYWIPWDYNLSFYGNNPIIPIFECSGASFYDCPRLLKAVVENSALRNQYYMAICEFNLTYFDTLTVFPWMDAVRDLIEPHVHQDSLKFYPNNADFYAAFEDDGFQATLADGNTTFVPGLKPMIRSRKISIANALANANFSCFLALDETIHETHMLFPNPSESASVVLRGNCTGIVKVLDASGRPQNFRAEQGAEGWQIHLENVSAGCYHILAEAGEEIFRLRWIIL